MTLLEYINQKKSEGVDVSYSSIARDIPCAPAYISMVASGKRRPSYDMARRIDQVTNGEVPKENWYPEDE